MTGVQTCALPISVNFQLKESAFGAASSVKIDLPRIMDIVKRTGYRGYLPIETLSPMGGNKKKKEEAAAINEKSANSVSKERKGGSGNSGGGRKSAGSATQSAQTTSPARTNQAARPAYDPFTQVPEFLAKVKAAQKAAFNE